tara:strand:+ start:2164 stop:3222 length:1059 start_codon:yes stop_codon:yes gene_type:complete
MSTELNPSLMMNNKLSITICIPSFNKPDQAAKTLKSLLKQCIDNNLNIKFLVIDNGSKNSYEIFFKNDKIISDAIILKNVILHRNDFNIGMSANFLRAFELSNSEWLWMVSDDDYILPNALNLISLRLKNIKKNIGFIKFISERTPQKLDQVYINSLEEFIDYNSINKNYFNGSIFISNGLYRLSRFKRYLEIGYQHLHTYIPHFLMISNYLNDGGSCVVFKDIIVDYKKPEKTYSYGFVAGLGIGGIKTIQLNLKNKYLKLYYRLFFPHNDFKIVIDIFYATYHKDRYLYKYLMSNYSNYIRRFKNWPYVLFLNIFWRLGLFKKLFENILIFFSRFIPKLSKEIKMIKQKY